MAQFPKKLQEKLHRREADNSLRHLPVANSLVDFSSNDYLGFSRNQEILKNALNHLSSLDNRQNGATGSRLLTGNHALYSILESRLADFHEGISALVFNSGYDANIGFFSAVPQRGDVIFYDEYIHASIRDGIRMGNAKSFKFKHNDLDDLKNKYRVELGRSGSETEIYVVTESVFSMDGDSPDLIAFSKFSERNNCRLIVDEAHAIGVFGDKGEGLVQKLGLQKKIFARIVTFGKALGCHGATILGSRSLKDYLVNFSRSFIYTTGLPPHSVATILSAYEHLMSDGGEGSKLRSNIEFFNQRLETLDLKSVFIPSNSAIHCCRVSGNQKTRSVAKKMQNEGFDIRAILSPTVPEGQERLRVCLHSFNTKEEIRAMLELIAQFI